MKYRRNQQNNHQTRWTPPLSGTSLTYYTWVLISPYLETSFSDRRFWFSYILFI